MTPNSPHFRLFFGTRLESSVTCLRYPRFPPFINAAKIEAVIRQPPPELLCPPVAGDEGTDGHGAAKSAFRRAWRSNALIEIRGVFSPYPATTQSLGEEKRRSLANFAAGAAWSEILVVEDNSACAVREQQKRKARIVVRIHRLSSNRQAVVAQHSYRPGSLGKSSRSALALRLLDDIRRVKNSIVVAGSAYGTNADFIEGLKVRKLDYAVELRPSTQIALFRPENVSRRFTTVKRLIRGALWRRMSIDVAAEHGTQRCLFAAIGEVRFRRGPAGHLFGAQIGEIPGVHRGTVLAITSQPNFRPQDLLRAVGWVRWIRSTNRRHERAATASVRSAADLVRPNGYHVSSKIKVRANITLARRQDEKASWIPPKNETAEPVFRGLLAPELPVLNMLELFSGAGGMGLGFLMAANAGRRYRLIFSGEINKSFVETLNQNHKTFGARFCSLAQPVPQHTEAIDLSTEEAHNILRDTAGRAGGAHVIIGGPPCQGFSNANRNSWFSNNPNNRLVEVFMEYIEDLRPAVFLMENVQGILWTSKSGRSSSPSGMIDFLVRRMAAAGYLVFPKLLDAVWYGVPQHRSRIFVIGIRKDLGYVRSDFGDWGPFPRPTHGPGCERAYVTVGEAIRDLPRVPNGSTCETVRYRAPRPATRHDNPFLGLMRENAPPRVIFDHVTSRHAPYVIERYRRIPPGGNWEDIAQHLTNYANVSRTHSNIYRRLEWDRPAITIGHYRKSMIVHPAQHRGLSLREAARLQSFPDWFRFSGPLIDQQQQLANAVCPLVAKSIAEFILRL